MHLSPVGGRFPRMRPPKRKVRSPAHTGHSACAQFLPLGRRSELPETGHCRREQREIASRHVDISSLEHRGSGGRHILHSEGGHRPSRAEVWVGYHRPAKCSGIPGNADPDARREGRSACGPIIGASAHIRIFRRAIRTPDDSHLLTRCPCFTYEVLLLNVVAMFSSGGCNA